jgi:Raf kinase inhibitor-like YbhB/YbcL family protein
MRIFSPDFSDGERLDSRFTCEGDDVAPELRWDDLPDDTKELALTCEDPDAPGSTFVHWVAWGIDPQGAEVAATREGRNDFGTTGYRGPCPPPGHGTHRYHFTLYALGEPLTLEEGATIDALRNAIQGAVLAEAMITGTYSR